MNIKNERWFSSMLIGGVAGFICFLLTRSPIGNNALVSSLLYLVTLSAFILLLIRSDGKLLKDSVLSVVPALIVSLLAFWIIKYSDGSGVTFAFNLSMLIALYCAVAFIQSWQKTADLKFSYSLLFQYSWNTAFIVLLAAGFTGTFVALLVIWAGLFKLLDISVFADFFTQRAFVFIIGYAVFSTGISLSRDNAKVIETFRRLIFSFIEGLMPILAFIGLLFVITLLFTGLDPLFSTISATALMLTVVVLSIWFANGLYQDGQLNPPYHSFIRIMVHGLLIVLPVYSLIAIYAMLLRINQYGLLPERIYGITIALILGLYSFGYAWAVFMPKDGWMKKLENVNIYMAFLVISAAVLLHSPVLDVNKLSANNQVERLLSGRVSANDFDYGALKFKLGKPGKDALDNLLNETTRADFKIISENVGKVKKADNYYRTVNRDRNNKEQLRILSNMELWPKGMVIPNKTRLAIATSLRWNDRRACKKASCFLMAINMDAEPDMEYVLLPNKKNISALNIYKITGIKCSVRTLKLRTGEVVSYEMLTSLIKQQQKKTIQSPLKDLKIGDSEFLSY